MVGLGRRRRKKKAVEGSRRKWKKKELVGEEEKKKRIALELTIDTEISRVMEYFEIFLSRMVISRRAARFLGCRFELIINGTKLF